MDIDQDHFWPRLLEILEDISNATFVSFDVEMSGISLRHNGNTRSQYVGKPTLQQQYEETKEAAETYQVLQIGITCVEEDPQRGMFVFALIYAFLNADDYPRYVYRQAIQLQRQPAVSTEGQAWH